MRKLLSLRLAPEWITDCPRIRRAGDRIRENHAPARLTTDHDVPTDLVTALEQWDADFQAVFTPDDPTASDFPDEPTTLTWRTRGEHLSQRLATTLGVRVEFHVAGYERVFTP